ncbi:hypothetical protein FKP32DRAFT_324150 [Trametes sanguinea]|nr:hypothetical protein FKP32DRAFT_324150 [Trametes sanguinea]
MLSSTQDATQGVKELLPPDGSVADDALPGSESPRAVASRNPPATSAVKSKRTNIVGLGQRKSEAEDVERWRGGQCSSGGRGPRPLLFK